MTAYRAQSELRGRSVMVGVISSWGFWFGTVVLTISFLLELARQTGIFADGQVADLATLFVQLTLPPTSLFVFIIAGLLVPPWGYLTGLLLGAIDALAITILVMIAPEETLSGTSVTEVVSGLFPLWVIALAVGSVVTGTVAWLIRRVFLRVEVGDDASTAATAAAQRRPTLVRNYRGKRPEDVSATFELDSAELARYGYAPTAQVWAGGSWGAGAFLVALLLFLVLLGLIVFIFMLFVKPAGTLTVTYELRSAGPVRPPMSIPPSPSPMPTRPPVPSLSSRLTELEDARRAGLITEAEYLASKRDILGGQ